MTLALRSARSLLAGVALLVLAAAAPAQSVYAKDVVFALDRIEKDCRVLIDAKHIDWRAARRDFLRAAKKDTDDQAHFELLVRLLARLCDGHASVELRSVKHVEWLEPDDLTGPGLFLCVAGKKVLVKNSWAGARSAGVEPGMELLRADGMPARRWLDARIARHRQLHSFSTDQQALFFACHWGLAERRGTRLKLELRTPAGKKTTRTLTYAKASVVPNGPAYYPGKMRGDKYVRYTTTADGWGYVHLRRCPSDLPARVDTALEALDNVPGMILDFRGNSGGGFDHDALLGRFVPAGHTLHYGKTYHSAGPHPYGGPVVVIVDATCRSAGETASGIFKEDGRAYMIGESPTAGMSAQKTTIELPSGKFALYVSVRSNKSRFQNGRGIEGLGVAPHELVEFEAEDLAAERDTLVLRAGALLAKFPEAEVPYRPERFGWKPPAGGK